MQAGQAWAQLGEHEAAEAVLSRGEERAQPLQALCFGDQRTAAAAPRTPLHQECTQLLFGMLQERLQTSLHLGQQVGAGHGRRAADALLCFHHRRSRGRDNHLTVSWAPPFHPASRC